MQVILVFLVLLHTGEPMTLSRPMLEADACWVEAERLAADLRKDANVRRVLGGCFVMKTGEEKA